MTNLGGALRMFVAHYGLAALFVLLLIEEAGVWLPLPGDLFVMYFGYRASQTAMPLLAVLPALLTVTAAVCCGSLLLYAGTRRFRGRVRRLGALVHLNAERLDRMDAALHRYGVWGLIPGRLIPGLRVPTTVVAGLFDLPARTFVPLVAVGGVLWGSLYLTLGGAGPTLLTYAGRVHLDEPLPDAVGEWLVTAVALAMVLTVVAAWRFRQMPHRRA